MTLQLVGERFGRLVTIEATFSSDRHKAWYCKCDCGNYTTVRERALKNGSIKSCGCLIREITRIRSLKHGHCVNHTRSKEYRAWSSAKDRCYCKTNIHFKDYGARGIIMCSEWLHNFQQFFMDMGPAPKGLTLDRIDNNGNYHPKNCRWTTTLIQNRNKRTTQT